MEAKAWNRWPALALAGVLLVAVSLRAVLVATGQRYLRSDEAVVGLMAKHIVTRGERPIFLYGQPYGGGHAIEAYLTAPLFAAFGRSAMILTGVSAAISVVCIALAWMALWRASDALTATAGALLYACSPPAVYQSVLVNGGNAAIALALGALLCFLSVSGGGRRAATRVAAAGLLSGLACWAMDYTIVYPAAFCLLWVMGGEENRWRRIGLFAIAFAVGCSPMIVYDLAHGLAHARRMLGGEAGVGTALTDRFVGSLWFVCRYGLAAFFSGELDDFVPSAIGPGAWLHAAVASGALVWMAIRERREIGMAARRCLGTMEGGVPLSMVPMIFVVLYLVLYAAAKFSLNRTPRYLLPLCPFISMVIAQAATWRRQRWGRAIGLVVIGALVARGAWVSLAVNSRDWHEEHRIRTSGPEVVALARRLEERGIRTVIAPYEIQWRLLFETDERVIAASDMLSGLPRYAFYTEEVRRRLAAGEAVALVVRSDMAFARLWSRGPGLLFRLRVDPAVLSGRAEVLGGRYDRFVIFYPLTSADLEQMMGG